MDFTSINYYILTPVLFIVDSVISISLGEITINSLSDLLRVFNDIENKFNNESTIPDKCLGVPSKIREEGKYPYSKSCLFFPGLNKIDGVVRALEKGLYPHISNNILEEYYDIIEVKINDGMALTILEYSMYLGLLNHIKNSNYKYYSLCTSDNENINC